MLHDSQCTSVLLALVIKGCIEEVGDDEGCPADDEDHVNLKLSEVGGSSIQIHDFHILIHVHYRR